MKLISPFELELRHGDHNKRCIQLKWGTSNTDIYEGEGFKNKVQHSLANVHLWHCDTCDLDLYEDWGR